MELNIKDFNYSLTGHFNCKKCVDMLYNTVYALAIGCKMDKSTLVNLKETKERCIENGNYNTWFMNWLLKLKKIYERQLNVKARFIDSEKEKIAHDLGVMRGYIK